MDEKRRRLVLTVTLGSLVLGAGGYYWLSGHNSAKASNETLVRAIRGGDDKSLDKNPADRARPIKTDSGKPAVRPTRVKPNRERPDRPTRRGGTAGTKKPKRTYPNG